MHPFSSFTASFSHWRWVKSALFAACLVLSVFFITVTLHWNDSPYSMPPDRDLNGVINEFFEVCSTKTTDLSGVPEDDSWIYFVTPTYSRAQQVPELTRLSHTLMLVDNVHWIVAEDSPRCSPQVADFLQRSGLPYTHLISPMPDYFNRFVYKPKGVSGRRAALSWLRLHIFDTADVDSRQGVIYFGDDDNTFDLRLFPELRKTRTVSMFPVGLIGNFALSSPIVKNGTIVGFVDSWPDERKFAVDMAGFAVSTQFLLARPGASMPYLPGHEEDRFLQSLGIELSDVLPLADNCTQVYAWHTKTLEKPRGLIKHPPDFRPTETNLAALYDAVRFSGMASVDFD